jgi:hypothetical protein
LLSLNQISARITGVGSSRSLSDDVLGALPILLAAARSSLKMSQGHSSFARSSRHCSIRFARGRRASCKRVRVACCKGMRTAKLLTALRSASSCKRGAAVLDSKSLIFAVSTSERPDKRRRDGASDGDGARSLTKRSMAEDAPTETTLVLVLSDIAPTEEANSALATSIASRASSLKSSIEDEGLTKPISPVA